MHIRRLTIAAAVTLMVCLGLVAPAWAVVASPTSHIGPAMPVDETPPPPPAGIGPQATSAEDDVDRYFDQIDRCDPRSVSARANGFYCSTEDSTLLDCEWAEDRSLRCTEATQTNGWSLMDSYLELCRDRTIEVTEEGLRCWGEGDTRITCHQEQYDYEHPPTMYCTEYTDIDTPGVIDDLVFGEGNSGSTGTVTNTSDSGGTTPSVANAGTTITSSSVGGSNQVTNTNDSGGTTPSVANAGSSVTSTDTGSTSQVTNTDTSGGTSGVANSGTALTGGDAGSSTRGETGPVVTTTVPPPPDTATSTAGSGGGRGGIRDGVVLTGGEDVTNPDI